MKEKLNPSLISTQESIVNQNSLIVFEYFIYYKLL